MSNKPFPEVPRDKILGPYCAYTPIDENIWLVRNRMLWALYAPEDGLFLSPFMYVDFDMPTFEAPQYCRLYTHNQGTVEFDLKNRCSLLQSLKATSDEHTLCT